MGTVFEDTRGATAAYMESTLAELRTMSQQIESDFLVYLLEMAMIEASEISAGKVSTGRSASPVVQRKARPSADQLAELFMAGELE